MSASNQKQSFCTRERACLKVLTLPFLKFIHQGWLRRCLHYLWLRMSVHFLGLVTTWNRKWKFTENGRYLLIFLKNKVIDRPRPSWCWFCYTDYLHSSRSRIWPSHFRYYWLVIKNPLKKVVILTCNLFLVDLQVPLLPAITLICP